LKYLYIKKTKGEIPRWQIAEGRRNPKPPISEKYFRVMEAKSG
jgi:hypothetical protein